MQEFEFGVQGEWFRVKGLGFEGWGLWFRIWGSWVPRCELDRGRSWVAGFKFRGYQGLRPTQCESQSRLGRVCHPPGPGSKLAPGSGFEIWGSGILGREFRIEGSGIMVEGLGIRD